MHLNIRAHVPRLSPCGLPEEIILSVFRLTYAGFYSVVKVALICKIFWAGCPLNICIPPYIIVMVKVYDGVAPLDLSSVLRDIARFRYIRQVCQWLNCLSTMQSGRCRWFVAFLLPGMIAAVSTQTGQQYMDTSAFVRQLGSQFEELPPFAEAFRLPKANLVSLRGLGTWQLTTTITKLRWRLGGRHGWKYEVKPTHAHKTPTHFPVDISIRHHGRTFLPVILCPGVTHLALCFQVKMKLQSKWTVSRCKHFCWSSGKSHALHDIRQRSLEEIVSHQRHHSTSWIFQAPWSAFTCICERTFNLCATSRAHIREFWNLPTCVWGLAPHQMPLQQDFFHQIAKQSKL